MYRKAVALLLYQITRSLPPPHAGCPRRDPGRLPVLTGLWTLDVRLWTRRATRSLRLPLLTICCVAGTVSFALSQEHSAPPDPRVIESASAVISIPTDGEFYFGKVSIAEADLPEMVKQALKDKPPEEQIAYIKAGVFVRYGTVVSVMDAMRAAGVDRIGLVANKKKHPDVKPSTDVKPKRPVDNSARSSDATLSAAPDATLSADPAVIIIDVTSKTRLKLNSKPMSLSRLESRLQKLLDSRSDKTVFIRAPRKMSYGDVVKVIDIAKGVGAQPIGLQVDHLQ